MPWTASCMRARATARVLQRPLADAIVRHLFAKNFIKRNSDIALLADPMGYESIETTRVYLRRIAQEQCDELNAVVDW